MKRTSGGLSGDGGAARGAQKGETMAQKTFARPLMFTRQALWRLILPLVLEQLLLVTVGMADTVMVSTVGEAAVSGISLVDQVNVLLIQIFAALATGGAVVASQYLGRRDRENACRSAKQLVYATFGMAVAIGALVLVLNRHILRLVFGNVEPDVMQAAETYFWLSALSYPMLALYNAGAALFRSMGNSRISLFASLIMNVINIGGNALLIYGLNWGVAGAATATLASRTVAGLMMMLLLRNRDNPIFLERLFHPEWNGGFLKSILRVGVPNGLENGMFQIGKLLVAGLITTFGTSAIAANAICNNVGSMSNIPGSAIGLAMITVVGQCVGAKDYQQARHYTKTLLAAAYVSMGLLNIALFLLAPYLVGFYAMPQTTTDLALSVLQVNCVVTVLIWPSSFTLPNALRAAGDARFTMVTSMVSMWVFRIGMSYVLGAWLGMGLFGVWTAMQIDWAVRSLVFGVRFLGHKWEKARVLEG